MAATLEKELAKIIVEVRENIDKQPDYDKFNEARTREAIVAPILRTMGWDVADFSLVDVEYSVHGGEGSRKVDYALWGKSAPRSTQQDKPATLLEAKGVNETLDEESVVRSIRHYAFEAGVPYVMLTNGKTWQAHVFPSANIADHDQILVQVDIHDSSNEPIDSAKKLVEMFETVFSAPQHSISSGWVSLKSYLNGKKSRRASPPRAIRFPDGEQYEIRFWSHLMEHTGNWLHTNGHLDVVNLPVFRNSRRSKSQPILTNQADAPSWKGIGKDSLFVWTGGGPRYAPDDVGDLLNTCKFDHEDVYLRGPR